MVSEIDNFTQLLRTHSVNVTAVRLAIFRTLLKSDTTLKNGEVASRTPSVNRASVYRTLELFDRLGVTTTLVRGWTPFIELAEPFKPHHHHLICERCDVVTAITSEEIEKLIHQLAKMHSFAPSSHHFEIKGLCESCQRSTASD